MKRADDRDVSNLNYIFLRLQLIYGKDLNEKTNHNYEIDFLISKKNKICPVEVKSSGYSTHKSLDAFSDKFSERILEKYMVYTKDLRKDGDIMMMPVYMVPFLKF